MTMFYIVLLIFFGLLFLVAELVLLPGVSIGAILALVCYGSSIYLAFRDLGPVAGSVVVLVILVLSLIATVVSLRAKTWQRFSLKQKINSSSMPTLPEQELSVRCVKHRIRHCAPIAGCGTGCRPDKTRQASHQAQMSNAYDYSEIQVPASPASVSSIRDNAPIHAGLPRLLT